MFYKAVSPGSIGHKSATFKQAAALAAKCGYEGYWFNPELDFQGDPAETRELLQRYNLKAAGFNLPVEYRKDEETYQAGMRTLAAKIEFARAIGITRCMTWIVPHSDTLTCEENMAQHARRLRPACELLKDCGMTLGLEFQGPPKLRKGVKHTFVYNLDGILELGRAIGTGNCGVILDSWHWDLAGQVFADFDKISYPSMAVAVHIADAPANVPADEQEDLLRRLPGTTGIINIEAFFAGLTKVGFDGPVIVEPFEAFLSGVSMEQSFRIAMKAMNRVWPD